MYQYRYILQIKRKHCTKDGLTYNNFIMKKILLITCIFILAGMYAFSQDTLVGWTFPTGTMSDSLANYGLPINKTKTIQLKSDSSIMFVFFAVNNTYAQAKGLTNGTAKQYGWNISLNTKGYKDIRLNSTQWACPMHSGPKHWKAQFKIGSTGSWVDIMGSNIECGLDRTYTNGSLIDLPIPFACNDNPLIYIRWIMTSDSNVAGSSMGTDIVSGGSMSRLDNIFITGTKILSEGDTLVGWTFPNALMSDTVANLGLNVNRTKAIHLKSDSMIMIMTKTSSSPPACAQAMGMSNATSMEKGWYIEFDATHYRDLKLFSRQQACPMHSGPKYWQIQYKVGSGLWTNVPDGNVVCTINWNVGGVVSALPLPAACNGASQLGLRWITTSDSNVAGPKLGTPLISDTSMTRIDDIMVTGNFYNDILENVPDQIFKLYPNPGIGLVNIITDSKLKYMTIYNSFGQQILYDQISGKVTLDMRIFGKGIFIIKLQNNSYTIIQRLIIQ